MVARVPPTEFSEGRASTLAQGPTRGQKILATANSSHHSNVAVALSPPRDAGKSRGRGRPPMPTSSAMAESAFCIHLRPYRWTISPPPKTLNEFRDFGEDVTLDETDARLVRAEDGDMVQLDRPTSESGREKSSLLCGITINSSPRLLLEKEACR